MNWDIIEGNWTQFKAAAREKWAKITDNDWDQIAAKKDKFEGIIQQRYGTQKDEVAKSVNSFLNKWKPESLKKASDNLSKGRLSDSP